MARGLLRCSAALLSALLAALLACSRADLEVAALGGDGEGSIEEALASDDQCAAGAPGCALSALQLRGEQSLLKPSAGFRCLSDLDLGSVTRPQNKGLCLDDTTFEHCSGEIPRFWPHTGQRILTMRLFKPWGLAPPTIFKTDRRKAWSHVKSFASDNNATFLLGVSVSCDPEADLREWRMAKEFMRELGPKRFMGLAIGNELELLWQKDAKYQNTGCLDRLWNQSGYFKTFTERVAELDAMPGFKGLPVTAVFGMYVSAGFPWVNNNNAKVNDFHQAVWKKFGDRFVFSINLYPYFDNSNHCDPVSVDLASTFWPHSKVPGAVGGIRNRMRAMGAGNAKLWVAETGWSTPETDSVAANVKGCKDFSSAKTFKNFYKNFLYWDVAGADHVFYFTIHDSSNFDAPEHFGLLGQCGTVHCKLQS